METYLKILDNILTNGKWKTNRTGIKCLTTFGEVFKHDMSKGFPLLTIRKMPFKSLRVELEGFIKGITDKRWYQERGCKYWDYWTNPYETGMILKEKYNKNWITATNEEIKKAQLEGVDLGGFYGLQWRNYNLGATVDPQDTTKLIFKKEDSDQLKRIIDLLKSDPNDRRLICNAWNPLMLDSAALPPCHILWNIVHIDGKLNLVWFQRSNDFCIGNPSNIASYGLLLLLICKETGFEPGELMGVFSDCHIYEDHLEQARQLLKRKPRELPQVEITNWKNIFDWQYSDVKIENYNPDGELKFPIAI